MRIQRDKRELTERNRQMAAARRSGKKLREIAITFGVSKVRVHVICEREQEREEFESVHNFSHAIT